MTPECSNSAWTLLSSTGATVDASVVGVFAQRPLFTATIGLVRARRPARRGDLARLPAREPAGQAGELARVAERLHVQQHDVRGGIGLPVLQHVVARQVRAV